MDASMDVILKTIQAQISAYADPIIVVDMDKTILSFNRAAYLTLGDSLPLLLGEYLEDLTFRFGEKVREYIYVWDENVLSKGLRQDTNDSDDDELVTRKKEPTAPKKPAPKTVNKDEEFDLEQALLEDDDY